MIAWLVRSSLRLTPVIVGAAALVLVLGVVQVRQAAVDTFPEFAAPMVEVQVEAPGLAAVEVEQLITVPMEDELNGTAWLDHLTSRSIPGLADLRLTFQSGTDLLRDRQLVAERLAQGPGVANVGTPPTMIQPLSSLSRVMMIGLSSQDLSLIDLSTLARWKIRPRLMGVPGVANVSIWGQRDQQLQVLVDPVRLNRSGVTLEQVLDTTGNALWSSPLTFVEASTPGADGFVDTPNQRLSVQHVLPITGADQLAQVPVADTTGPTTIRLGDVATVVTGNPPLIGDGVVDDQTSLVLVIEKFPGANTLQVTHDVQAALDSMRPGLRGVTLDPTVYRPASYLDSALRDIGVWGLLGLLLAVLLLGALLYSWRAALISMVAVMLGLVAASYLLYLRGTTFTLITAAGLMLALGVIIDDAVIGVMTIRARLAAYRGTAYEGPPSQVVVWAVRQVGGALGWATAIVALVAVPVYTLGGVAGAFARPLVISYLLAVLVSTLVALSVTPALAWLLLRHRSAAELGVGRLSRISQGPPARALGTAVGWAMAGLARRRAVGVLAATVLVAGGVTAGAMALATQLPGHHQTIPTLQERDLLVQWQALPGTSAQEMDRLTERIVTDLRAIPAIQGVTGEIGRAVASDQVVSVDSGQLWINIRPGAEYEDTITEIHQVLDQYPGVRHDLMTYSQQQLQGAQPAQPDLTVRIFGNDYATLQTQAARVRHVVAQTTGVTGTTVAAAAMEPTITIQVNLAAAEAVGLKPGDVRRAAAALISGTTVGSLYQDQAIFDVVVWGEPADRQSITSVQNLLIDTPSGGLARLGDLASVTVSPQPVEVDHYGASRYVDVTASLTGDPGQAVRRVDAALAGIAFPQTYHAEVTSDLLDQRNARMHTLLAIGFAVLGGYLLLQAAFQSWRRATLLGIALLVAPVGGVVAARFVGGVTGIGALAGLLGVFAVAARTGVRLVRRYQQVPIPAGGPAHPALLAATRQAAAPAMVSMLVIAATMTPFAIASSGPGSEILHPLAVVVLAGLVTTIVAILFVLPALYLGLAGGQRGAPGGGQAIRDS